MKPEDRPDKERIDDANERIRKALDFAIKYGGIAGDHHKAWVIDQMVRALVLDRYESLVAECRDGEDGPNTFDWDEGVAP